MLDKSYYMKKKSLSKKCQFHYIQGVANFDEKFYIVKEKKGFAKKANKMLLWPWIFQNWSIFYFRATDEANQAPCTG